MDEHPSRLTLTEIADRVGVGLSAVSNWRSRYDDFPQPLDVSGQEQYDLATMVAWLRSRQIPANRRRPDESPGATYGDRLERAADSSGAESPNQVARARGTSWQQGLWSAMSSLRGTQDETSARELLLALVYVRACHPEAWKLFLQIRPGEDLGTVFRRLEVVLSDSRVSIEAINALRITADRAVLEAVESIDKIDLGRDLGATSHSAELADAILADLERGMGKSGGQFTPAGLADCLAGLLDPVARHTVLDPFCVSGELLLATKRAGAEHQYGQPPNDRSLAVSAMNLALHGLDAKLSQPALALDLDRFSSQRFDRVISNPPFNLRRVDSPPDRWTYGEPPSNNANYAWLQWVLSKLNSGGRAAVVMAPGAASSQNRSESIIRRNMIEAGVIECVISLPGQLFRYTGIPSMIWVLAADTTSDGSRGTLIIDGTALGEADGRARRRLAPSDVEQIVGEHRAWRDDPAGFRGTRGFSNVVDLDRFRANDFTLMPRRYVTPAWDGEDATPSTADLTAAWAGYQQRASSVERADAAVKSVLATVESSRPSIDRRMVSLGTICEIVAGPGAVSKDEDESDGVPLVLPRNISNGRILGGQQSTVSPKIASGMDRYRLDPGDVVSARVGTLGRYGRITDEQRGWLLGPGCMRFRPDKRVDPDFLIYYLSGRSALRWVNANASGSAIQHLSVATLHKMPIWLPPHDVQREIAQSLAVLTDAVSAHEQAKAAAANVQHLLMRILLPN